MATSAAPPLQNTSLLLSSLSASSFAVSTYSVIRDVSVRASVLGSSSVSTTLSMKSRKSPHKRSCHHMTSAKHTTVVDMRTDQPYFRGIVEIPNFHNVSMNDVDTVLDRVAWKVSTRNHSCPVSLGKASVLRCWQQRQTYYVSPRCRRSRAAMRCVLERTHLIEPSIFKSGATL